MVLGDVGVAETTPRLISPQMNWVLRIISFRFLVLAPIDSYAYPQFDSVATLALLAKPRL